MASIIKVAGSISAAIMLALALIVVLSDRPGAPSVVPGGSSEASATALSSSGGRRSHINIQLSEYSWDRALGTLPSECLYELSDLTKLVPDKCCDPSQGATQTDSWSTTAENICTSRPLGSLYIRDWAGCYTDSTGNTVPAMAELCIPSQYSFGTTYPMTEADATAPGVEGDYTISQCRCGQYNPDATYPDTTYAGIGCHVAVSPYQLGDTSATTAFFAKVEGSCDSGNSSDTGLIVGLAVGVPLALVAVGVVVVCLHLTKKQSSEECEPPNTVPTMGSKAPKTAEAKNVEMNAISTH